MGVEERVRRAAAVVERDGGPHDELRSAIDRELREAIDEAFRARADSRDGAHHALPLELQLLVSDRLASVGTLAAGIAHEINNPLAYVIANLAFIASELRALEPSVPPGRLAELRAVVTEARDGADRVSHIVSELKTFARSDDEPIGPVDVRRVLTSVLDLAANTIRYRGRLETRYEEVPPVRGKQGRLGQLFLNLIINATQALREETAQRNEIWVTVRRDGDERVAIEVRDNGAGIAPEVLPRIFDPFFTTKPVGHGTGLGLSICHGIAASLGGSIEVASRPGDGSTFVVLLPAATAPGAGAPRARRSTGAPTQASGHARILVIDDEPLILRSLQRALRGHELTSVTTAEAALARLAADRYDVLLCDVMMPDTSGIDFYEELRRRRPGEERKIVFMTGGAFTMRARQFLATVPNRCLDKPFDPAQLRAAIEEVLAESR
jgi:signal transduction histidine kinase